MWLHVHLMVQVHGWNVAVCCMYMLKNYLLIHFSKKHSSICAMHTPVCATNNQLYVTTTYHNTMKPNIPVLDWMFNSSSSFVHLQNKQKQTALYEIWNYHGCSQIMLEIKILISVYFCHYLLTKTCFIHVFTLTNVM